MIHCLIVLQLVCAANKKLSTIINDRINAYPVSGEINFKLAQPQLAIKNILTVYQNTALVVDNTDGISLEFTDWRFNLRMSNTEPLVRLNIETRSNKNMLKAKTKELLEVLASK